MEVTFTELLARHVYCPASFLFILFNFKDATFFPELSSTPFLIHATPGGGFPEAVQATVAGILQWNIFLPERGTLVVPLKGKKKRLQRSSRGVANLTWKES